MIQLIAYKQEAKHLIVAANNFCENNFSDTENQA